MNSSLPSLSVNLLPPEKLYCNFSYWSSLFSQDMQILRDRAHGVPLEKLPKGGSDMIFPYLLLALSDYKTSQINKMNGIGLDILLSLWFDKYLLNNNGYRSKVDVRNEKIGYKIREATLGRVPLIAVIGDKEEEIDSVALRALDGTNLGIFDLPNLYKLIDELIEKKGRTE